MPEILLIKTIDWDLIVWTRDISRAKKQLSQTLAARNKTLEPSMVGLSPSCVINEVSDEGVSWCPVPQTIKELPLAEPLFFENKLYDFELVFNREVVGTGVNSPQVRHKLQRINAAFHFSQRYGVQVLRGSIDFNNDIGWFYLPLRYLLAGEVTNKQVDFTLSFEVLPTKLDLVGDLNGIYRLIDRHYPLWYFALARPTQLQFERSDLPHQSSPLLWLAQFESLREALESAIRRIVNAPHSRLLTVPRQVKAHRLKGKVAAKLAERLREDMAQGLGQRTYQVQQKQLSVDTPENRFIKMVLQHCHDNLSKFVTAAKNYDQLPGQQRLSNAFFERLQRWQAPLDKYRNLPLFHEVGQYVGLSKESLVLQQKTGYANVYRIWQLLSRYLEVLGNETSISVKSIAELYEVWCFLQIKLMLVDLGFEEQVTENAQLVSRGLELRTVDGFWGAFSFKRGDGIYLRLAHEPLFSQTTHPVHSAITTLKPDIVLEARFAEGERIYWLFDAKYRLADKSSAEAADMAPSDAINQMHSYRDALFEWHPDEHREHKSRPVFGGFALYPGFFGQQSEASVQVNPYYEDIERSGIGAFAMLPGSADYSGSGWLKAFLTTKFGKLDKTAAVAKLGDGATTQTIPDTFFVKEIRIAHTGMQQIRHKDLCLLATGAEDWRQDGYYASFVDGSAKWFHMRLAASVRAKIDQDIIFDIGHCIIAIAEPDEKGQPTERKALWSWPVVSVSLKTRDALTLAQTGKPQVSEDLYWLFELGEPRALRQPIHGFASGHHYMKLTKANSLAGVTDFAKVTEVYDWLSQGPA